MYIFISYQVCFNTICLNQTNCRVDLRGESRLGWQNLRYLGIFECMSGSNKLIKQPFRYITRDIN